MTEEQPNNPLHGVTLKAMLETLLANHGWEGLGQQIPLHCFKKDPSIKSSLNFLRKTDWARGKVEALYVTDVRRSERKRKRNQRRKARRAAKAEHEERARAETHDTDPC